MSEQAKTFEVDVIQVLAPRGEHDACKTDLPAEVEQHYHDMIKAGCHFEAEVLSTGEVSLTISRDQEDVDILIAKNGPQVQQKMVALLRCRGWEVARE